MTALAADFDGDGWTDIYVASDSTAAILYRNNHDGTFTDVAIESGTAYSENGNAAGRHGRGRRRLQRATAGSICSRRTSPTTFRRSIGNLGKGLFEDVAMAAGLDVQNRYVEWGAGLPDSRQRRPRRSVLRHRQRLPGNRAAAAAVSASRPAHRLPQRRTAAASTTSPRDSGDGAATPHSSRGAAFGDVDNDGDIDVLVMNMNEPPSLLRNDYAGANGWIEVALEGTHVEPIGNRRDGRSSTAGGRRQARAVLSQSSYYSHDDLRLHFGLGAASRVDEIEVRWPSGKVQMQKNVEGRRVVKIVEQ